MGFSLLNQIWGAFPIMGLQAEAKQLSESPLSGKNCKEIDLKERQNKRPPQAPSCPPTLV